MPVKPNSVAGEGASHTIAPTVVGDAERSSGALGYSSPTYCWCGARNILGCISEVA
ncbi:MAG: hypothetical protein QGH60_13485 [Phycisphaerae bacterium]|nr:hypothetical protein [Phycisphaerae bacterium]